MTFSLFNVFQAQLYTTQALVRKKENCLAYNTEKHMGWTIL